MRSVRVVVSGYHGYGNVGDEAVLAALVKLLRPLNADVTVLSSNPEYTRIYHGVEAINRDDWWRIAEVCKDSDVLISGGGSLFQDIWNMHSMHYYGRFLQLGLELRKKVVIIGQGLGPINRAESVAIVKTLFPQLDGITLRDSDSAKLLKEICGDGISFTVTADPAFVLNACDSPRVKTLLESMQQMKDRGHKIVGVVLRPFTSGQTYVEQWGRQLRMLQDKAGVSLVLLPFHPQWDSIVYDELQQYVDRDRIIRVNTGELHPCEILNLFTGLDYLVGMRLHSLIFATITGTPFLAVSYDPKIDSYIKCIQYPGTVVSEEELCGSDTVFRRVSNYCEHGLGPTRTDLMEIAERMRELAEHNCTMLISVMEKIRGTLL